MNDFQFDNLIEGVRSCFKRNYCAMYFSSLAEKFCPEISEEELEAVLTGMYNNGELTIEDGLFRLVVA